MIHNTRIDIFNCLVSERGGGLDWSGVGVGGYLISINHAWMCVSKSEGYGSLFGFR